LINIEAEMNYEDDLLLSGGIHVLISTKYMNIRLLDLKSFRGEFLEWRANAQ